MKRYGYLVPVLILSSLFHTLLAQAPDTLWTRTYGPAGAEVLFSIDQTADGGFIMSGEIGAFSGSEDYWLVRTDDQGDTLWTRTFANLSNGAFPAGYHQVTWTGRDALGRAIPSGIYIARLVTPEYTKSIKMVLLK